MIRVLEHANHTDHVIYDHGEWVHKSSSFKRTRIESLLHYWSIVVLIMFWSRFHSTITKSSTVSLHQCHGCSSGKQVPAWLPMVMRWGNRFWISADNFWLQWWKNYQNWSTETKDHKNKSGLVFLVHSVYMRISKHTGHRAMTNYVKKEFTRVNVAHADLL